MNNSHTPSVSLKDKAAFDSAVENNMGLVYKVAKMFMHRNCEFEDLVQIGAIGLIKFVDKYFTLPFSIINASPFHTSLFVTNLASIRTNTIHHHLYEFGTTGIFISMGQPKKKAVVNGETVEEQKIMELGIVTDERIANGHYYGRCFRELNRYLKNPELLETKPETVVKDPDVRKKNPKFIVK